VSRQQETKSQTFRVNLKLDYELDDDLIAWMGDQPRGALSQAIREALRRGLEAEGQIEQQDLDYEYIRQIIADELTQALAGLRLQTKQIEDDMSASDTEVEYGARLDRMLGGLSANTDPGDS
jgi:hypothetical protein